MKYLPPIFLTDDLYEPIEETINRIFYDTIYAPQIKALGAAGIEITNSAPRGLESALRAGRVYIVDRQVYGTFNVSISKELKGMGATFDKRSSTWKLPPGALSARLQTVIADIESQTDAAISEVFHTLEGIQVGQNVDAEKLREQYGTAAWRLNENFIAATKAIAIAPQFTKEQRDIIAREWATNLELYIQKWQSEEILKLRQQVQQNTMRGQRAENLVKMIQTSYGTSKTKAKFLARQETSLLVSKMREQRYRSLGSETYRWNGVNDSREREDHKLLNGTIHSWSNPPITNRETGARNHPGEDFNCFSGSSKVNVLQALVLR